MRGITLVTGGAGFIGSHVVDALVEAGRAVRVLDALLPSAHDGRRGWPNPAAEFIHGDLREPDVTARALRGVDAVCHQASMVGMGVDMRDVADYVSHNDLGTAVLLRALATGGFRGRIVLASSMVVYGEGRYRCGRHGVVRPEPRDPGALAAGRFEQACPRCGAELTPEPIGEDAPLEPRSIYAATKVHQEHLLASFSRECGVPTTLLRYHNVYGPRMPRDTPYAGVASVFRSALASGRAPRVFEDGRQMRDFVHVVDVARANVLALCCDEPFSGAYNVASGEPHTIDDMARALAGAMRGPEPVVTGDFRLGDVRHVFASPLRAKVELGFVASIRFEDGMRELASAGVGSEFGLASSG